MRSSAAGAPVHTAHSAKGGNSYVKAFVENLTGGDREIATCFSSLTLILAFLPLFKIVLTLRVDLE